jgi:hypothetical protein
MPGEFSVFQFFPDDTHECVRQGVDAAEAVEAAMHYATSIAARMGLTRRVIITDGDDFTTFEWKWAEGITYPPGPGFGELKRGQRQAVAS